MNYVITFQKLCIYTNFKKQYKNILNVYDEKNWKNKGNYHVQIQTSYTKYKSNKELLATNYIYVENKYTYTNISKYLKS